MPFILRVVPLYWWTCVSFSVSSLVSSLVLPSALYFAAMVVWCWVEIFEWWSHIMIRGHVTNSNIGSRRVIIQLQPPWQRALQMKDNAKEGTKDDTKGWHERRHGEWRARFNNTEGQREGRRAWRAHDAKGDDLDDAKTVWGNVRFFH